MPASAVNRYPPPTGCSKKRQGQISVLHPAVKVADDNLAVGAAIVPWGCSIRLELADACSKKLIVLRRKETEGMHICCPM